LVAWKISNGRLVRVGIDPFIGGEDSYLLPNLMVRYLNSLGIHTLDQCLGSRSVFGGSVVWISAQTLGLSGFWSICWDAYIDGLHREGICLGSAVDSIVWTGHPSGSVSTNALYSMIFNVINVVPAPWWSEKIWNWNLPVKLKCFMWLCLNKKILTWDTLRKRGWQGPGVCCLCKSDEEFVEHLFVHCPFTKNIWHMLRCLLNTYVVWGGISLEFNLKFWVNRYNSLRALPGFTCLGIWCYRNSLLFNNKAYSLEILVNNIKCSFYEHQKLPKLKSKRIISGLPMTYFLVKGFFDGAAQRGFCGAGFVLQLNHFSYFRGWMVGGVGTNTKARCWACGLC
jgi:hypothetical protein